MSDDRNTQRQEELNTGDQLSFRPSRRGLLTTLGTAGLLTVLSSRSASAAVLSGENNRAPEETQVVAGGKKNEATGPFAAILGGRRNTASKKNATVGAGIRNTAEEVSATVSGGSGYALPLCRATTLYRSTACSRAVFTRNPVCRAIRTH